MDLSRFLGNSYQQSSTVVNNRLETSNSVHKQITSVPIVAPTVLPNYSHNNVSHSRINTVQTFNNQRYEPAKSMQTIPISQPIVRE